jgi:ABC-type uncharacterized transport system substrate-binding protein
MPYPRIFALIVIFVLIVTISKSWAHPHVFFSSSVKIVFDQNGLAGFKMQWQFDEMFTSMIKMDYDKNGNNHLEKDEVKNIENSAFANLRKFNYFTHIKINSKVFKTKYVTDFSAALNDGQLSYTFFVPCHVRAIDTFKTIALSIYDQTYYCSVSLAPEPLSLVNDQGFHVRKKIKTNRDKAYYYGQIYPEEIIIRFKKKK